MSIMLLRLDGHEQGRWWLPTGLAGMGELRFLAPLSRGHQLWLIAPSETLTLHRLRAPERNRSAWLKALPYALEDQLAEDVEQLHFSVNPRPDAQGYIQVTVVRRERLATWQTICQQHQLPLSAIVPEPLLLPWDNQHWSAWCEGQRVVVRCGQWDGFACTIDELATLLELALDEQPDAKPISLRLWGERQPLEHLPMPLELMADSPSNLLLAATHHPLAINLLPSASSATQQTRAWLAWRWTASVFSVWVLLHLAGNGLELLQLQRQQTQLQAQIEQTFRRALPEVKRVVNPRAQLEAHLRQQASSTGQSQAGLLAQLYFVAQGLRSLERTQAPDIKTLRFANQRLELGLNGGSLQSLEQLRQQLVERQQFTVQLQSRRQGDTVDSQLSVSALKGGRP